MSGAPESPPEPSKPARSRVVGYVALAIAVGVAIAVGGYLFVSSGGDDGATLPSAEGTPLGSLIGSTPEP